MDHAPNASVRIVMVGWKNGLGIRERKEGKDDEGRYGYGLIPCGTKKF